MKDTLITVFKDLFKTNDVPYIVPLDKVLNRIRVGKSSEVIDQVRKGNKDLKKKLPAILFSGEFEKREDNGLKKHSGLICLDYDKFKNEDQLNKQWETLTKNKHVVCCFISPSGNGIKAVIRVPECDSKTHYKIFQEFNNIYPSDFFDFQCSNVSRVCFESYDPNMYINYNAEIFNPEIKDEGYKVSEKPPLLPINDESVIIDKIMNFNWKKDFVEGERNNFVFDIAGMFCEYGISESTAEGYLFNNVCTFNKDYTEREALNAIKSAYKRRSFGSKYFEDYDKQKAIRIYLNKGKKAVLERYKIDEVTFDQIKEELTVKDFWYYEENSRGDVKLKVDALNYKLFFLKINTSDIGYVKIF